METIVPPTQSPPTPEQTVVPPKWLCTKPYEFLSNSDMNAALHWGEAVLAHVYTNGTKNQFVYLSVLPKNSRGPSKAMWYESMKGKCAGLEIAFVREVTKYRDPLPTDHVHQYIYIYKPSLNHS